MTKVRLDSFCILKRGTQRAASQLPNVQKLQLVETFQSPTRNETYAGPHTLGTVLLRVT